MCVLSSFSSSAPVFWSEMSQSPLNRRKFRAERESRGKHQETLLTSLPLPLAWHESDEKQGHCVESSTVPFAVHVRDRGHHLPLSSIYCRMVKFGLEGAAHNIEQMAQVGYAHQYIFSVLSGLPSMSENCIWCTSSPVVKEGVGAAGQWQLEAALQPCLPGCPRTLPQG